MACLQVTSTGWTLHNLTGVYTRATGTDYLLRARESPFCADQGRVRLCLASLGHPCKMPGATLPVY